jgi:Flp pilus assembly protein TadG
MLGTSIFSRFRKAVSHFGGANQANVAVIFGLAIVPVVSFVGAAIDYSRANSARSSMQAALDSAALMLAKDLSDGTINTTQITAKAQAYFTGLYNNTEAKLNPVSATYTASTSQGSTILLTASGSVTTDFMKVAGFPDINFNTSSTAAWGNVRMRVALALDNTGSMSSDDKIGALRTAANSLVDQLSGLAKNPGDVYISVVPFSKDVNFGNASGSNSSLSWIDWTDWEAEAPDLVGSSKKPSNWSSIGPGSNCPWSMQNNGFTCVNGPGSTTAIGTIPNSGTNKGLICPGPDPSSRYGYQYHFLINGCYDSVQSGSSYTHTWKPNARSTWSGCLTDRTQPYDTQNTAPTAGNAPTLFPAEQYYENNESYCASTNSPALQAITPLSYSWSAIKTGITAMQPTGGTNQPVGLAWAWQTLQQTAPFSAPAEDTNYTYKKAIILLSDGLNTEDRWPAYGDGQTQVDGQIDARQRILCDNIKAQGVTIYTVQVNTGIGKKADPTSAVLQYCASGTDKFYLVTTASQTLTVFNSIGTSLSKLRVAR